MARVTPAPTSASPVSAALFERASAVTPGGVNSPVRAFNAVGGTPRFIRSAQGAWLTDVDGASYVDLICSWGPMLLGHAHPEVQAAVQAAVARGTSYGTPTEPEVELAEEIVARTSVERVRFVSSGTEATMSAIRLARGFTGRDVVVKFAGCYHGHVDSLLASAGSGLATFATPGTPGVPASSTELTLVLPYNDRAAVTAAFAEHGDRIACLITEAAPGNMGVVPPEPGFNAFLAETCTRHGALFISDEVMTGFRASRQGQWGLDGAVEGWQADLVTFGKVMGGGFPAAAFGGRADVMSRLSPQGPVYQAGTLSGNPVATTAGLATLRLATDDVYTHLTAAGDTIKAAATSRARRGGSGARRAERRHDVLALLPRPGPGAVRDFADASETDAVAVCRLLPRHAGPRRLPPAVGVRSVVPVLRPRRPRRPDRSRRPARGRARGRRRPRGSPMSPTSETTVHLLRHGEVHNPDGVLYGRRDGFHLSDLGVRMAERIAESLGQRDITHLRVSPLERAQETARPLAAARGLEIVTDERVIESTNVFEGKRFGVGDGALRKPSAWRHLWNPFKPSWGEPYKELSARMMAAVHDARDAARGHEAVIVSHQLPIWTTRLFVEGRSYLHDPRKRQCTLCSVTSLHFVGDELDRVSYSEPAGDLIPNRDKAAPFSAGGAPEEHKP